MPENPPKQLPLYFKAKLPARLLEEVMAKSLPEPLPEGEHLRLTDIRCDHRGGEPEVTVYARRWSKIVDGPHG